MFAFVDDDLAVAFYVEIDEASVGENDPKAKAFHADLFDRFALHHLEGHYSFRLRPYHDLSVLRLGHRCNAASSVNEKGGGPNMQKRPAAKGL